MANYNCYVRIYLPLAFKYPEPDNDGWFDLQIDGLQDVDLEFDGHTKVNSPVFSFGGINGKGYVKIFPEAKTHNVYNGNYLLCKMKFTASDTKVDAFIAMMRQMLTYSYKTNNYSIYYVNSGPFVDYNLERCNPFGATAAWCSSLGYTTLLNIYNTYTNNTTGYKNYTAWKMFDQYYTAWQFNELHN